MPVPDLVPSGLRLGLWQHRLRGSRDLGRRPPCSGCVVDSSSAQRQWRSLGARSMLDALSFMISTLERSQVGGLFVLIQERVNFNTRYHHVSLYIMMLS